MDFKFDKFVKDIEKREISNSEKKRIALHIIEEDILRRRRSELYQEKWQNRIKWENTNGN